MKSPKKTVKVCQEQEIMVLSEPDWRLLMNVLENPPQPNEALKKASKNYRYHQKQASLRHAGFVE